MKADYRIIVLYGVLFAAALLLSAATLFALKTGFCLEGIQRYYAPKSFFGLSETARPHLFAMGAFVMVLGHFFLFTPFKLKVRPYLVALYFAAFATITTSYAAASWGMAGSIIKWLAVALLLVLGLVIIGGLLAAVTAVGKTLFRARSVPGQG